MDETEPTFAPPPSLGPKVAEGEPSNQVYERVGETIKLAAHDGVHKGLSPQDIIREIAAEHGVHLNVGELRLLLAARRVKR
ncbi:MAG TPA: hypothetical protein VF221_00265 [Chloroflexota bacterium]